MRRVVLGIASAVLGAGAFVLVESASAAPVTTRLYGADTAQGDELGFACAIQGSTVIVAAPFHDASEVLPRSGGAYAFVHAGSDWEQQQGLGPPDPGRVARR